MKSPSTYEAAPAHVARQAGSVGHAAQSRTGPSGAIADRSAAAATLQRYQQLADNSRQAAQLKQPAAMMAARPSVACMHATQFQMNAPDLALQQGRDQPTTLVKAAEAGVSEPAPPARMPSNVIQGKFGFRVDPDTYKIVDATYHRIQGAKYLTGNKENKHVTADAVKDSLWSGTEGMDLVAFGERLLHVSDEYLHLPGLELLETHKLHDVDNSDLGEDDIPDTAGLPDALVNNYNALDKYMEDIPYESNYLDVSLQKFKAATSVDEKNSAAFIFQNTALKLISSLEKFRDLMPLVNIVSGIQNPGREREAKKFLNEGVATKNVKSEWEALWAFFDFAAISELVGEDKEQMLETLQDALPWISLDALTILVCQKNGAEPQELEALDYVNCVAGLMLGNHIKLIQLSYPDAAKKVNFDSYESVLEALNKNDVPVNRKTAAEFAFSG
jgi:hypothetical protein